MFYCIQAIKQLGVKKQQNTHSYKNNLMAQGILLEESVDSLIVKSQFFK